MTIAGNIFYTTIAHTPIRLASLYLVSMSLAYIGIRVVFECGFLHLNLLISSSVTGDNTQP
jgi:hypothetical protein